MTLADYSMMAFALLNGGRVVAYMPQIVCVYRDQNGAAAVSLMTWVMFSAANLATVSLCADRHVRSGRGGCVCGERARLSDHHGADRDAAHRALPPCVTPYPATTLSFGTGPRPIISA
jgi:hypothetical protein